MKRFFSRHPIVATVIIIVFFIGGLVAIVIGPVVWQSYKGGNRLVRMLNGDRNVEITKIVIEFQQRRIICDNVEICRYFTDALCESQMDWKGGGGFYRITLTFDEDIRYSVYCLVLKNGLELSIPADEPFEPGEPTRTVNFRGKVPAKLTQMWEFLDTPHKEISGKVLHVPDEGEPYFTFDQAIWDPN